MTLIHHKHQLFYFTQFLQAVKSIRRASFHLSKQNHTPLQQTSLGGTFQHSTQCVQTHFFNISQTELAHVRYHRRSAFGLQCPLLKFVIWIQPQLQKHFNSKKTISTNIAATYKEN